MQPIRVVFLGTGDAFSAGGRNQAAILIQHPQISCLLDCGATTLAALNAQNLSLDALDYVLLSHLHGDHMAGLPFLYLHLCYIEPRTRKIEILGPEGLGERSRELFSAMYPDAAAEPLPFAVKYTALQPDRRHTLDGLSIEPFRVPHLEDPPSLGYTLYLDGRRIVYSGDSGWTDELETHAKGADLFICECSFFESKAAYHLDYPTIVESLARCGAKRLILTHLGQEVLQHSSQLELEIAYDGSVAIL